MGWTSYHATHYTKQGNVDRKRECDAYWLEGLNAGHFAVIKSAMIGATYYAAIQALTRRTGHNDEREPIPDAERETFAVIFRTSVDQKDYYNFAYKDMDESMFPEANCPISILECLSETDNETAKDWRRACLENAEKAKEHRKSRNKLHDLGLFAWISFTADRDYANGAIPAGKTITLQKRCRGSKTYWTDGHYRWPSKFIPADFTVVQ